MKSASRSSGPKRPPNPLLQQDKKKKKKKASGGYGKYSWVLLLILVILLGIRLYDSYHEPPPSQVPEAEGELRVQFIDVGQADAALLTLNGQSMLIDGGNVGDGEAVCAAIRQQGLRELDYLICTHAHEDHVGGLAAVLSDFEAETVFSPVTDYDSRAFRNFAEKAGEITVPEPGYTFDFGSARAEIYACDPEAEDTNNTSIVLKLTFGQTSFLFTGDAEYPVEQTILDRDFDLSSSVLKVGHHGSSSSTSYRFLNEVMPQYAVISVGEDNSYGHPHEEVLSRLRDADVKVYRTDKDGDVVCISDGKRVTFSP